VTLITASAYWHLWTITM